MNGIVWIEVLWKWIACGWPNLRETVLFCACFKGMRGEIMEGNFSRKNWVQKTHKLLENIENGNLYPKKNSQIFSISGFFYKKGNKMIEKFIVAVTLIHFLKKTLCLI